MPTLAGLKPLALLALASTAFAALNATDTDTHLYLSNERMSFALTKKTGYITEVTLDGVNLLGDPISSSTAIGPYVDGMITKKQSHYTPKGGYRVIQGTDSAGIKYGAMVVSEEAPEGATGEVFEQYWFLREGETSLHAFTRIAYHNSEVPFLTPLTELRTLFRPYGNFWTHMSSAPDFWVPQAKPNPSVDASHDSGISTLVQDTTWYLGDRTGDPYVEQVADYWTKYSMSETYRDHIVHGLYADGTTTPDGRAYGAWMVYNSKDTFYGGPTFSDLTVDGITYNYIASNHHGNQLVNITDGFERTWGPSIFHFNAGEAGDVASALSKLRGEAEAIAPAEKHAQFYDDIAEHVPGYVTTAGRGTFNARVKLPQKAKNVIAILSAPGYDYQDNVFVPSAYQYWVDVSPNGKIVIPRVKAGDYRLTLYADEVFGDFVHETVSVTAGGVSDAGDLTWVPESAGTELWRIGTPDKSAGEYRHGYSRLSTPLQPPEYRIYWGNYDFINEFPEGVKYTVGQPTTELNYVHWSTFGSSLTRPEIIADTKISNWTIEFNAKKNELKDKTKATFTIQFAGVTTAAGNTDVYSATLPWNDLPYYVTVNGHELEPFVIPYHHSGSCATRSGIICYQVANKFVFPASHLLEGDNEIMLALPFNATGPAVVPVSISVMYDAMRLEVE